MHLLYVKKLEAHIFYYLLGVGFIAYGIQIFFRAITGDTFPVGVLYITAVILISAGFWSLSRKRLFLAMFSVYPFVFFLLFLWERGILPDAILSPIYTIGVTLLYTPLITMVVYHRVHFGKAVDKFLFGLPLLVLANSITFSKDWVTETFATFAKILLFYGVIDYDFIVMTQRIRRNMSVTHLLADTENEKEGTFRLILCSQSSTSLSKQVTSIESLVHENAKKAVNTFVFAFQDVIPHKQLRRIKGIDPSKVSIFLFSASAERIKTEFTLLPMGLTQIGAVLSETVRESENPKNQCAIIFSNLSLLVHLFKPYPVYNMLLNKMGALREKGIELVAYMNPETHADKSVVSLFADIADEAVKL
jgi:hypothetical protein